MRKLKGLEDVVGLSVVHPTWKLSKPEKDEHIGWAFGDSKTPVSNPNGFGNNQVSDIVPEPFYGAKTIRELYDLAGDTAGAYSVPLLWDKKEKTIVSNESADIVQMFNSELNEFAKNKTLDLAPTRLHKAMADVDGWIYDNINNGVYRCGFANT